MTGQNNKRSSFSMNGKWMSMLGLLFLTVGLIFMFKHKNLEQFVNEQKETLTDFYTQNLEPLLVTGQLTKEDVFNFAFYKEIPLDKQNNQVLQLGNDNNGKEYFEFRKAGYIPKTNNLDQFSKSFDLNKTQKQQLDSILNTYKDKIQSQILVNDKNTMAINSNMWNLNRAILADVLLFASKANKKKFDELDLEKFNPENIASIPQVVSEVKASDNDKYIFINSDTVFTKQFKFDKEKSDRQLRQKTRESRVNIKFDQDLAKMDHSNKKDNFQIHLDSNFCRVQIPEIPEKFDLSNELNVRNMEKFRVEMDKAAQKMKQMSIKFHMTVPPQPPKKGSRVETPRTPEDFELNIDLPNVDSLVKMGLEASMNVLKNLHINVDSLSEATGGRKLTPAERAEIKKEMEKVKKEMEQIKKSRSKQPRQKVEIKSDSADDNTEADN